MDDPVGAFVPHGHFRINGAEGGAEDGPLAGLTFAAKDIIDVAGHVTGCGNPDWLASHDAASATAPCIQVLLDAGASLVGKTVTEELATGLTGENIHYGTPANVNAPGRVSGGSSSGSAAAVAAGLASGRTMRQAVSEAKAYVGKAIEAADRIDIGQGHGPVHHFYRLWT